MTFANASQSQWMRLEKNAPGAFYGDGSCLACGVPEGIAPDLLSELAEQNDETYFVRQPETPDEVERACRAILACCTGSLRYGGSDPTIIRRLGNRNETCDQLLPGGPVRRLDEGELAWVQLQTRMRRAQWKMRAPLWKKLLRLKRSGRP